MGLRGLGMAPYPHTTYGDRRAAAPSATPGRPRCQSAPDLLPPPTVAQNPRSHTMMSRMT